MDKPTDPCFEDCLRELERTVARLEAGDLPLEESLALFEKGVGSLKACHAILDCAEKRVRILVRSADGSPALSDDSAFPLPTTQNPPYLEPRPDARKKSGKQHLDADPSARQNAPAQSHTQDPTKQPQPPRSP